VAIYPAYRVAAVDPSITAYWEHLTDLPFWPTGPLWFIGQLLVLNIVTVGMNVIAPDALKALGRWSALAATHPARYAAVLLGVSALAYVPLAIAFTPWAWADTGPLAVQYSRPLLYAVYYFAGIGLGAQGLDRGLMAADGLLAQYWGRCLAAALVSVLVWMGLTALTMNGDAPLGVRIIADVSFAVACEAGCCSLIAASLRFATNRSRILDSLSGNAYGIYLVHYDFIVWLQYALFGTALLAVFKAAIVFAVTLGLSWLTVLGVQRIPLGARLIGATPRAVAAS
jgi:surface polysaccharide O-acyltransferase-like enzyme